MDGPFLCQIFAESSLDRKYHRVSLFSPSCTAGSSSVFLLGLGRVREAAWTASGLYLSLLLVSFTVDFFWYLDCRLREAERMLMPDLLCCFGPCFIH